MCVCSYISTSPQLQNSGICYDLTHEYDEVLCSSITWVLSLTKFYHRICNTVCSCWFHHKPRRMNQLQNCFTKAIGWTISGHNPSERKRFISSSKCPAWPYGPHSLLFNTYQKLFPHFPKGTTARIWCWSLIHNQGQY